MIFVLGALTTTEDVPATVTITISVTTTTAPAANQSLNFQWASYTVDASLVKEAPYAVGIGSSMLILLIAFMIFFILLDLSNYHKSLKRGYKNCRYCCATRKCQKKNHVSDSNQLDNKFSRNGFNVPSVIVDIECSEVQEENDMTTTTKVKQYLTPEMRGERSLSVSSSNSVTCSEEGISQHTDRKSLLKNVKRNNFYKKQSR